MTDKLWLFKSYDSAYINVKGRFRPFCSKIRANALKIIGP